MSLNTLHTDVLVLGAGLAGMRAAWAALETRPDLKVTVVNQCFGPSGSSFANINDKLGMQVCRNDRDRENFVREVLAVAPPGGVDPVLVRILAEESDARFLDLGSLGFPFDRDEHGGYFRATGCFSPTEKRAFIFSGLSAAFEKLKDKFQSLGGHFLEAWVIQDLVRLEREEGRVCGAVLQSADGDEKAAVAAKAVIIALGGPAPLFFQNVAGLGTQGVSYALLKRVGGELVNTSYLQFMWHTIPDRRFWPVQGCLKAGVLVRNREGDVLPAPRELFALAAERSSHCPIGYGFPDSAVDQFLIENTHPNGTIEVLESQSRWRTVAVMAHAGNGGARIDENGWTGVPGFYACGECAGGMHGANRIGGAMVTSTQVFGARAGKAAAIYAADSMAITGKRFSRSAERIALGQIEDEKQRREMIPWLRNGMQAFAVSGGRPGLEPFMGQVRERLTAVRDWRTRMAFESALIVGESAGGE